MSRVAPRRPLRPRALLPLLAGLWLGLPGCARFGFDLLPSLGDDDPSDQHPFDAGLTPVSHLDAGVLGPGGSDPGGSGPGPGGSGGNGSGGVAGAGTGGAGTGGAGSGNGGSAGQPEVDAGSVADGGDDPAPPRRCALFGAFDAPTQVQGLAQSVTFGPAFSDDALTLLYVADNPYDIFSATRADRDSPFSAGTRLAGVNQNGTDATPFLADGGLTLLLASDRGQQQAGFNDLMIATRPDLGSSFGTPAAIANVNSAAVELSPQLSEDGLRLYFSSDRQNNNRDIYVATRSDRGASFSSPVRVQGLNSASADFGPSLDPDELEVFIASDRNGGQGSMDLWRATRTARDQPFGTPQNLSGLNSNGYDTDPRLSPDGLELFFSSSRGGAQVLWSARRPCLDP